MSASRPALAKCCREVYVALYVRPVISRLEIESPDLLPGIAEPQVKSLPPAFSRSAQETEVQDDAFGHSGVLGRPRSMLKPSLRTSPHGASPAGSGMIRDRVSLATLTTYLSEGVLERVHLPITFLDDYVVRPRRLDFPTFRTVSSQLPSSCFICRLRFIRMSTCLLILRYLSESSIHD
jgi:hypothetical protein